MNGQPALGCYQEVDGVFRLSALNVLTIDGGRITWIASFPEPGVLARTGLLGTL